ncbi:MAG: GntR family transcriptional regulator [Burkholderiales bacterium]
MNRAALPLPRYHQIYLVLRERVASGEFPPERPLPGELELARAYGVSRVTIRAALARLAKERLVRRERGRGTFPKPPRAAPARAQLSGFFENLLVLGLRTTVRIVDLAQVKASPEVAAALKLAPGAAVQKAIRVRSHRGRPVSLITTYVPADVARAFGRRELAAKPMLQLLEEAGVRVIAGDQTISAQLADHVAARALEVGVGSALLAVKRIVYGAKRRPVQYLLGLYRPDRYEYRMHLSRSGGDRPRIWMPS